MKTKIFYSLFVCVIALLTGCGTAQKGLKSETAKRLFGLWEVKAIHNSNEGGYKKMPHGMFKMIIDDGRFVNFMTTEEAAMITVDGTYRLVGDSLYIEQDAGRKRQSLESETLWTQVYVPKVVSGGRRVWGEPESMG